MKKRGTLLFLLSLICAAGCSADTTGGTQGSQETSASIAEHSSESTAENVESAAETTVSPVNDTTPAETKTDQNTEETVDIFGLDGNRLYNTRIEAFPDCVYSAEEWLSDDGSLKLPFDEKEKTEHDDNLDFKFGRYYIPEEAIKAASTEDLLGICTDTCFAKEVICFDRFDLQVQSLANKLNAVDAVFARDDFAEVLLQAYQEDTLAPAEAAYNEETNASACAVITEELFLARNEVFDQMTDEMREKTLSEVMKKQELIESGEYDYSIYNSSCFLCYAEELHNAGDGRWYEYLEEHHPEYLE